MPAREHRPRLLLLTPDFPPARGGIQTLSQRLAVGLRGFETMVVTLDSTGARRYDASGGTAVRRVGAGGRRRAAGRGIALNAVALREALRFRPDVTLSAHLITSPAAAVIRRALGARTVQYFYAKEIPDKPKLAAFAAARADRVIAISAYTAGLIAAAGVSEADVTLIPPGVDLPADPGPDFPDPAQPPTLLTIARLRDRYKGHDVLIRALARVRAQIPDVQWVVIGDGPLRADLEGLASASGVADSARFLGEVADAQRDEWLRRADLLAMPSRLPGPGRAGEGFGIVYLEAGAHGKPVLAGAVAGALDAVIDGGTGLLVDPTDPLAVADAIVRLLLDRELARRLGDAGAKRARDFAWPAVTARVETVLLDALDASSRCGRRPPSQPVEHAARTAA